MWACHSLLGAPSPAAAVFTVSENLYARLGTPRPCSLILQSVAELSLCLYMGLLTQYSNLSSASVEM